MTPAEAEWIPVAWTAIGMLALAEIAFTVLFVRMSRRLDRATKRYLERASTNKLSS